MTPVQELDLLREKWDACMAVRRDPRYLTFSESTLRAEAEALERMRKRKSELLQMIERGE